MRAALIAALALAIRLPVTAEMSPIPCAVGNRWEYDTVKLVRGSIIMDGKTMSAFRDTSSGSSVYEIVGVDEKASPVVYDYKETTRTWSTKGGEPNSDSSELRITSENGAIRILSTYTDSSDERTPDKQVYDPPLLYYVAEAVAGKSWEVGLMREREVTNPVTARGAGRENVTVPAGTFKDCLKVVYSGDNITGKMEMWGKPFTVTGGRSRGVYWIAEGVGVVKELEVATTVAESEGPGGKKVLVEAASCTVSELRPGYVVKGYVAEK
ncbi:MAG: hypothetical protein N3B12_01620 [Armatimonadetes bacterium]|nr:hypothetical protein [Armatimonadota bacterium]